MSRKWFNPPLNLVPATNSDERSENLAGHAGSSTTGLLHPANAGSDFASRRESGLSETQYAIAGLPSHYLDLPSAVPFQDAISTMTPALPSAEFPSSARGFVSPPGTSSTSDFPSTSVSVHHQHQTTYQQPTSPEIQLHSNPSIRSNLTLHASSADPTIISGPPGATALNRADSTVSYNSVWSGEGSNQHFTLDITQFPRPPDSPNDALSPPPTSATSSSFHPMRRAARLRPPASPLYEESEPSASMPSTPGAVSYRFPVNAPSSISHSDSTHHAEGFLDPRHASVPTSLLAPPSPAGTSFRGSFQSHLTAASRGSTSPRLSIIEDSGRTSALVDSGQAWDHVMNSVKPHWNSSDSAVNRSSALPSTTPSIVSAAAAFATSSSGQGDGNTLLAPSRPSLVVTQSPMSGESNSDVYSAIGRMSFPKPPLRPISGGEPSPISPNAPRSTWITGVTLKTRSPRGSLGRQESLKRLVENSPTVPAIPPLPQSAAAYGSPPFAGLDDSPVEQSPIDHEAAYSSSGNELRIDSPRLGVPVDTRGSSISGVSDKAPSYDRRVSDLVRATNEPPERNSVTTFATITTDSPRSSVDGAIVGVARTASLSARARALLTRGPSLKIGSQEVTLSYLVPSPLPSAQPSEISLPRGPPTAPLNIRRPYEPINRYHDPFASTSLQRPPPILDSAQGAFPESVGSSQSFGDGEEGISLHRIQSNDGPQSAVPHSAVPLNQSTPFQNYFPASTVPTSYRPAKASSPILPVETPSSAPSRSGSRSKSRRSSIMSTLARTPSRVAKSMSWFRRKPLPALPPSPPQEKKSLPHPDDGLTTHDLAIRAAVMNQYLDVGELPYTSPTASPHPDGRGFTQRLSAPRLSVHSVLSSLSDRARGERRRAKSVGFAQLEEPGLEANTRRNGYSTSRRRNVVWFVLALLAILAAAIPIGVVFGRRAQHRTANVSLCTGGVMTGATCQLNATCVCTSAVSGKCNPVAQALLDLVPSANGFFGMNLTADSLSVALWDIQGEPPSNCASQAILVDVAPALNETTSPNRTQWARTAILYNLVRTEDLTSTASLRSFVADADFSSLRGQDGPVSNDSITISVQSSGFVFDFAAMTVSPTSIEWKDNSGADQTQIERVGFFADQALDKMYSFATASSIQRSTALTRYWKNILQLHESDIPKFVAAVGSAPVILPFDTSSSEVAAFLSNTTSNDGISLPAPVACLTDVSQQGRENLGYIEQNVFGLAPLGSSPSTLQSNCFPDRPLYGVLDVLRLRRPFGDARTGMRIPTAQLIGEAAPRVILHSGEQLVGLTGVDDSGVATQTNFTALDADPRVYGTLSHLNHVALSWLQAFPSLALASQAAQFVLNSNDNTIPPAAGNPLFDQTDGFTNFPIIEVSVFGSVLPTDIETFRADLGTSNGTLFFGSSNGETFRQWALRDDGDVILWSNSTTAAQVVQEHAANNTAFEAVWSQATGLISAAASVGRGTGIPEMDAIVSALQNAQLFT